MAHANGIITAPINIETDIYAVLGIGPTAQGYDIGYACKSVKVNKWSFYKPIPHSNMNELSKQDFCLQNDGFTFNSYSNGSSLLNDLKANAVFMYSATSNTVFRFTDFNNYRHNQYPWISISIKVLQGGTVLNVITSISENGSGNSNIKDTLGILPFWQNKFPNSTRLSYLGLFVITNDDYEFSIIPLIDAYNINSSSNFAVTFPSAMTSGTYKASLIIVQDEMPVTIYSPSFSPLSSIIPTTYCLTDSLTTFVVKNAQDEAIELGGNMIIVLVNETHRIDNDSGYYTFTSNEATVRVTNNNDVRVQFTLVQRLRTGNVNNTGDSTTAIWIEPKTTNEYKVPGVSGSRQISAGVVNARLTVEMMIYGYQVASVGWIIS